MLTTLLNKGPMVASTFTSVATHFQPRKPIIYIEKEPIIDLPVKMPGEQEKRTSLLTGRQINLWLKSRIHKSEVELCPLDY